MPLLMCTSSGPDVIKLFSCSTQLSMKFQLFQKKFMLKIKDFSCFFKLSDVVFIMLINVKMPTIVGILTFMSKFNFILSLVEHEQCLKIIVIRINNSPHSQSLSVRHRPNLLGKLILVEINIKK